MSDRTLYLAASRQAKWADLFSASSFTAEARSVPFQWHIWTDGQRVISALCANNRWETGPNLSWGDTLDGTKLSNCANEIISKRRLSALGLIIHVGDEFAVIPTKATASTPDQYEFVSQEAIDNPANVVESTVQPGTSYRFVPTLASRSGVAVQLRKRGEREMSALIHPEGVVRLSIASAPLELVSLFPYAVRALADAPAGTYIALFIYPSFTVLAVYDGSGPDIELSTLVALPHGNKDFPQGVAAQRVQAEITRSNISKASLYIVSAGGDTDAAIQKVVAEVQEFAKQNPLFATSAELITVESHELRDATTKLDGSFPEECFRGEFAWGLLSPSPQHAASQNFSTSAIFVGRQRITRSEATMAVAVRTCMQLGTFAFLAWLGFTAFQVLRTVRSPEWNVVPAQALAVSQKAERLAGIQRASDHWAALLTPRGEAWAQMEFISNLFPESGPFVASNIIYRLSVIPPDKKGGVQPTKIGYLKTWVIEGLGTADARPEQLNRAFVENALSAVERSSGRAMYLPGAQRLSVSASSDIAPTVTVGGVDYTSKFSLSVEVAVSALDTTALPTASVKFPASIEL